jgi:putative endonuclease
VTASSHNQGGAHQSRKSLAKKSQTHKPQTHKPQTHNQRLGAFGEEIAATWYLDAGYEILDRNWRVPEGELDLVCRLGRMVVFCEVKTRSSDRFGTGAEAVGRAKQARIHRLATLWLRATKMGASKLRFDVADVDRHGNLRLYEGCF